MAGLSIQAQAATVFITSAIGEWISVEGGTNVAGQTTDTLSWGGVEEDRRSSYTFQGVFPAEHQLGEQFDLGVFTHNNFVIPSGTGILGTSLRVFLEATIEGRPISAQSVFTFDHWETPNWHDPCANGQPNWTGVNVNGCADRVVAVTNPSLTRSFTINGLPYVFSVSGFLIDDSTFSEFWTEEARSNQAVLRASVVVIPLPPTAFLLLGGLGLLVLRKKLPSMRG
jgi:hypothetical protein